MATKQPTRKYTLADVLFEREIWNAYYDGMEALADGRLADAEKYFERSLGLNLAFPGSYEGFAYIFHERGDKEIEANYIRAAFEKAKAMYAGPYWPKRLPWSVVENRLTLRIILMFGMLHHENGDRRVAWCVYEILLKMDPGDHQGVRHLFAGLKRGLVPDEISARQVNALLLRQKP